MLFVKENVCERGFILDTSDASVTRQAIFFPSCACVACIALVCCLGRQDGAASANSVFTVCRSHAYYTQLFDKAGLRLTHTALQKDFPKGLFKGECCMSTWHALNRTCDSAAY